MARGDDAEIFGLRGDNTRIIDLAGLTAIPGLDDAHFHLAYYGMMSGWLSLADCRSIEDIVGLVRERAGSLPAGAWIYGRGWDPADLVGSRSPIAPDLDQGTTAHPVLLARADGHVCVANSEALRRAGITDDTPNPVGGHITRGENGTATGELSERALYLAWDAMMAELGPEDFRAPILKGAHAALRAGITTAHAILLENVAAELEALRLLDEANELPIRVYGVVQVEALESLPCELLNYEGDRVRIGAAKIFADGTLFAGTAALRAPYTDAPTSYGDDGVPFDKLVGMLEMIRDAGLQPAVHAVGDRTIERVLDALEVVYGGAEQCRAAHPRIEHATVLAPDLLNRARYLGVILSIQPRRWRQLSRRLGPRRAGWVNPWPEFAANDAHVIGGSDAPFIVPQPDAWQTLVQAVERGVPFLRAVGMIASGAALAARDETPCGLSIGSRADMTVLSADPANATPDELRAITPVMTIVGGELSYMNVESQSGSAA